MKKYLKAATLALGLAAGFGAAANAETPEQYNLDAVMNQGHGHYSMTATTKTLDQCKSVAKAFADAKAADKMIAAYCVSNDGQVYTGTPSTNFFTRGNTKIEWQNPANK